jgi:hypothetical protein
MTIQDIKSIAPAIFTTSPDPKMSKRYSFVPTIELMENFTNEGWELSSVRQNGKGIYGVHEIRFRNGELPAVGDTLVEAIVRNSHNGMTTLNVGAGLFRLVCSNGLTVATSTAEQFNIRHTGFNPDDVKRLTESFAKKLPIIQNSVDKMMDRMLTEGEKIDFAKNASIIKWGMGSIPATLNMEELITPIRKEDEGDDLWKVFNVVQEKFIKGGVEYKSNKGRKTSLKGLKNIMATNQMNTKLWTLAEAFVY